MSEVGEQEVDQLEQQFLLTPVGILQKLTAQFEDQTLSRARVSLWHKKLKNGHKSVEIE